jgi:ribosomal protein S12 methylthiotransferase accessory factor
MDIRDEELTLDDALKQAISNIGNRKNNLLYSFGRIFQYSDEPKFFQYYAQLGDYASKKKGNHGTASGFSFFSQKLAVLKCLMEALERYSLNYCDTKKIIFSSPGNLNKPSLDLSSVVSFSKNQRETNSDLRLDLNGSFSWVLGKELSTMEEVYIPAQLVYLAYRRKLGEGLIRLPISTGAACGTAFSSAIYRGLCEIIERDAFMITYLNKLSHMRVPLKKSKNDDIQKIIKIAEDYKLELYSFDITTDLGIYVFLTIIHDNTGIAASISTGLKCSLNPTEGLLGSLLEAFHPRTWLRREKEKFKGDKSDLEKPYELSTRGVLWSSSDMVNKIGFLLNSTKETKVINEYKDESKKTSAENLQKTIKILTSSGYNPYFVDITPNLPKIKKTNIKAVMTIIPELQPLYLDERYPYFGGDRLYSVPVKLGYLKYPCNEKDLNKIPHPFL